MKRYIAIYKRLLVSNWNVFLEYRSDLVTRILASLIYASWHLIVILLLTYKVPSVFGWTKYELLLLASTYNVFISIYHMFISRNLDRLADEIYFGRLDFVLLKPIDDQLSTTLWIVDYVTLVRLLLGIITSLYIIHILQLTITISMIIGYCITIITGLFILYSLWLPFITLMIFNPRLSNIVSFLFTLTNVAQYPKEMYARLPVYIFVPLIPLALIMTTPTKVLLQKFSFSLGLEFFAVCILLGTFSRLIWKFSLRFYTGASA